jgi:hypothetical protein
MVGRWTSGLIQLLGLAGLLACIVVAAAILLGRAWIGVGVGHAFTTVDATIADGLAGIDDATGRLTDGAGTLDGLLRELGPLPSTAPVPAAVAARVSQVVDSYNPARDRYVEARSKARAALDFLELSVRVAPGPDTPAGVSTALADADGQLARIDTALVGLRGAARGTAGDVAAAATMLREAIGAATVATRTLRTEVDGLRMAIADVHAGVDRALWISAGVVLGVVGYVALLDLIVIWLVRRRPPVALAGAEVPGEEGRRQ